MLVGPDGACRAAGGVLIQLLPFADEGTIEKIEKNLPALSGVSRLFDEGKTPEEVAGIALDGIEYHAFDTLTVGYRCTCSRKRVGRALLTLSPYELYNILVQEKTMKVNCQFCDRVYEFDGADIEKLREEARKEKEAE